MLIRRPATERGQTIIDWLKSFHSFSFNDYYDRNWHHFHDLRVINEDLIAAGTGFGMHPHQNMEILTYLTAGEISHQDSLGNHFTLKPGDWQRMSAGTGIVHQEWNESSETTHLWQIWIRPNEMDLTPSYEQKNLPRISGQWQLIASNQENPEALFIHQNMQLLRFYTTQPTKIEVEIAHKPCYFQLTQGSLSVNNETFSGSDAFICEEENLLELTLNAKTELLLFQFFA